MSAPAGPPDDWSPPAAEVSRVDLSDASSAMDWGPPSPSNWQPPYGWVVAAPAPTGKRRSNVSTGLALFLTLAVVAGLISGIGAVFADPDAEDAFRGSDQYTPSPGPVATPTPAPNSLGYPARNPPPPPYGLNPVLNPATDEWDLPPWPWEDLPVLADGANNGWAELQSPELADVEPPVLVGCADPSFVTDKDSYEKAVREQWHCVHASWLPTLKALNLPEGEPEISFYRGASGRSDCGMIEAPAFYCPLGEGTAHFGRDTMEVAMYWDLMVNDTVHHEYAHHIQNLIGIMDAADALWYTTDIDRRLELQATCWASAMTMQDETVEFDVERWEDWRLNLEDSLPDAEHGTLESLRYWGIRGLYAKTMADCNTWSVPPERVS